MNRLFVFFLLVFLFPTSIQAQPDVDACYELRIYDAHPGKLDALLNRFRTHTTRIFARHGMKNIGYWVPNENEKNQLVYVIAHENCDVRDANWQAFIDDPEWKIVAEASSANGPLVANIESTLMKMTDYSPATPPNVPDVMMTYEWRVYTTHPGKLDDLHTRFRDHTMRLFERQGMVNILYFEPITIEQGARNTLIYFLAHKDQPTGEASWTAFRADPDWVQARADSRRDGPIVSNVVSVFMTPTDFSPLK